MDELRTKINAWVEFGNEVVHYDKVIEDFLDELEHQSFIHEVAVDKTPKQPKKKRNVLSTINDSVTVEGNESIVKINGDKLSLTKQSLEPKLTQAENNLPAPQLANERPGRVAKCKAFGNLREPNLFSKMRHDVKMERTSINKSITSKDLTINQHTEGEVDKSDSRMLEVCSPSVHTNQESTEVRRSNNKKVKLSSRKNSSIEILAQPEIKVELLSDEEKDRMPPPTQPPPKTKKKTKQANKSSNSSSIEKIIPASEIKEEKSDSTSNISTQSKSSSRLKRTKGKAKQNTSENDNSKSQEKHLSDNEMVIDNPNPVKEIEHEQSVLAKKEGVLTLNATFESVYEDAISDNAKKTETSNSNEHEIKNVSVVLTKISASSLSAIQSSGIDILDSENMNNVTFNMNITRPVNPGDTFIAEKEESNSTFVVPKINGMVVNENQNEDGTRSSLITDDESEIEESNNIKSRNGGKKEIFNPLIQSPVRKKVQAFEQHAAKNSNLIGSPAATRVTRIKSRVQDLKEIRDTNTPVSRIPKPETPNADPKPDRYYTPKDTTSTSIVNLNLKKKYNSTSKLHGSSGGLSSKSSTSRENSVEDLKRGGSALQLAAEEKKRKREEKQKHAQQVREAKEREKREAAERIAREKQEKSKKLLQEREERARQEYEKKKIIREHKLQKADLQKNLEEIQKNLQFSKYMEQKRDEQYIQEIQKKKLADKERDLLDVARMNAMRDEIHRNLSYHIQETSSSKPAHKQKKYDFDLLLSGDSTDEEEKQTTKKPPPPTWSLSKVRQPVIRQQNYIQWKIVDKLFSVQPMTIDLQEIFPTIDSRYLKRNSSVIWSTPPRYSELPKY